MDRKIEVVDFDKVDQRDSWFTYFLLHASTAVEKITSDPNFRSDELQVSIQVNGVDVLVEDFDKLLHEVTAKMLEERIEKEGWNDVDLAAKKKAEEFFEQSYNGLRKVAEETIDNLERLSGMSHNIVESHWKNIIGDKHENPS